MDDRFVELCIGGKFILRFNKNEDGSYGRFSKDEILEFQRMMDDATPTDEDYMAALGPCGK